MKMKHIYVGRTYSVRYGMNLQKVRVTAKGVKRCLVIAAEVADEDILAYPTPQSRNNECEFSVGPRQFERQVAP
jgi:hypothetical protein